jgi:crossover junction endodeoxyribonuclease RusA
MQPNSQNPVAQPIVMLSRETFPEQSPYSGHQPTPPGIPAPPEPEWAVWLPFPPTLNSLFAHGVVKGRATGRVAVRRFPTATYRKWRREADVRIIDARIPLMREPVTIALALTPPDKRPRDADNYSKGVIDALVAGRVLPDDNSTWVKAVRASWLDPSRARAGVRVTIRAAA